ncbi:MAG: iron ABC transporter permease [Lachnospiraceae bacterium]|nr:iron ABC transporter permease [Lachnospiraceae bacterium]
MTIVMILLLLVDLFTGSSGMTVKDALSILMDGPSKKSKYHFILWAVRMPMTMTCLGVGASLALAGGQMQTILQNPLASPYTLGISSAAGFGAALSVVTGFPFIPISWINISVSALIFALGTSGLIFSLCKKNADTKTMILIGIVVTFLFSALQSLMQYLASQEQLSEIMHWMFGSLSKASSQGSLICLVCFGTVFALSMCLTWPLTCLSAGEERAKSLGINTEALRRKIYLYSSLLTAVSVSYVGSIGFIGLVAPHLARSYVGDDQRFLMVLSPIMGAIILLCASVVAKHLKPGEIIPVGIITNLVGVSFLLYLLLRKRL